MCTSVCNIMCFRVFRIVMLLVMLFSYSFNMWIAKANSLWNNSNCTVSPSVIQMNLVKDNQDYQSNTFFVPVRTCANVSSIPNLLNNVNMLCEEVFKLLSNMSSCSSILENIKVSQTNFSVNMYSKECKDIRNFKAVSSSNSSHRNHVPETKVVCDRMCQGKKKPICDNLLWGYKVRNVLFGNSTTDKKWNILFNSNDVIDKSLISNATESFHASDSSHLFSVVNESSSYSEKQLSTSEIVKPKGNSIIQEIKNAVESKQNIREGQHAVYSTVLNQSFHTEYSELLNESSYTNKESSENEGNYKSKQKTFNIGKNSSYWNNSDVEKTPVSTVMSASNSSTDQNSNLVLNDNELQYSQIKLNLSSHHDEDTKSVNNKYIEEHEDYDMYKVEPKKTSIGKLFDFANVGNETVQTKNSYRNFSLQRINKQKNKHSNATNVKSMFSVSIPKNYLQSDLSSSHMPVVTPKLVTPLENPHSDPDLSIDAKQFRNAESHSQLPSPATEDLPENTVYDDDTASKETAEGEKSGFNVYDETSVNEGHELQRMSYGRTASKFVESNFPSEKADLLPEQENPHFLFYFFSLMAVVVACYLILHNKQKIIALIIEGCHERRRRPHGVNYKKLETK